MEKNPNFTKERADFVFNKIEKYYDQNAYRLALSDIIANRELLSSLNVGSQLKLNRIYSQSVVHMMLDAFEVDGDLPRFNELFHQNKTVLELHIEPKTFELLNRYHSEKDANPNFKSKSEHYDNKDVPVDDSIFPEENMQQIRIKTSTTKMPKAIDIERDFLDAIEPPSFQYPPLNEEELQQEDVVIKSNIDKKAIHADFFDSIRPPDVSSDRKLEDFEQIGFDEDLLATNEPTSAISSNENTDSFEPISLDGTILGKKEDDTVQALRAKIQSIDAKASGKPPEPPPKSNIKQRREVSENGQILTETIYKSGGKVLEITLDEYRFNEYPDISDSNKSKSASNKTSGPKKNKKKSKKTINSDVAEIKKDIAMLKSEQTRKKTQPEKPTAKKRKGKKNVRRQLNYPFVALLAVILCFVIFGGYKVVGYFRSQQPPAATQDNEKNTDLEKENEKNQPTPTNPTPKEAEPTVQYLLPTNEREITDSDLANMSKKDVRLAINEMFARYGWNFGGKGDLYEYFSKQSWYQPNQTMRSPAEAENKFNTFEKKNLSILSQKYRSMT